MPVPIANSVSTPQSIPPASRSEVRFAYTGGRRPAALARRTGYVVLAASRIFTVLVVEGLASPSDRTVSAGQRGQPAVRYPKLRDLGVQPLDAVEPVHAHPVVAVLNEVVVAQLVEITGGNSTPLRKALSIRFHLSDEASLSGINPSSNRSCFPTLPTTPDATTVLLPRRTPRPIAASLRTIEACRVRPFHATAL